MSNNKISFRYASSLLDIAIENNNLDLISKDMDYVIAALESSSQLVNSIKSPVIKPQLKLSILKEVFSDKISKKSMDFLLFLLEKKREEFLHDIVKKFLELKDDYLGIVNVNVLTAFDFNENQKQDLKNKLEKFLNKKTKIHYSIDSEIIGGFIAKVKDTVYDASVKHQLKQLKKQFLESGVTLN